MYAAKPAVPILLINAKAAITILRAADAPRSFLVSTKVRAANDTANTPTAAAIAIIGPILTALANFEQYIKAAIIPPRTPIAIRPIASLSGSIRLSKAIDALIKRSAPPRASIIPPNFTISFWPVTF